MVAAGLWLIGLALTIVVVPERAERFLTGFASSARAHYTEQLFRLIAGSAIIVFSPEMRFPGVFRAFGWLIVLTTLGLIVVPWRWHREFGKWAIPLAVRHIKLYALGAFALGAFILYAVFAQSAHAQTLVSFPTRDRGIVIASEVGSGTHAVVLAHGGRFTKESWAGQIPAFVEAGLRTLAIDFRGRGASRGGPGLESDQDSVHLDVLAAVEYLRETDAQRISIIGASFGGWASARASTQLDAGQIEALVLLAHSPISNPEDLPGRKLFVTTEGDADGSGTLRLPGVRDQFDRSPDPKELLILPGSAHAQFIFKTEHGPELLAEILRFLADSTRDEAIIEVRERPSEMGEEP